MQFIFEGLQPEVSPSPNSYKWIFKEEEFAVKHTHAQTHTHTKLMEIGQCEKEPETTGKEIILVNTYKILKLLVWQIIKNSFQCV